MFSQVSVCPQVGPLKKDTIWTDPLARHIPRAYPPGRHPPCKHPLGRHLLGRHRMGRHTLPLPSRRPLQRTVRILLESIFVECVFKHKYALHPSYF